MVGRADGRAGAGGREDIRIAVDRQAEQMVAWLERTARTSDVAQQLRELAQALTQDEPQQGAALRITLFDREEERAREQDRGMGCKAALSQPTALPGFWCATGAHASHARVRGAVPVWLASGWSRADAQRREPRVTRTRGGRRGDQGVRRQSARARPAWFTYTLFAPCLTMCRASPLVEAWPLSWLRQGASPTQTRLFEVCACPWRPSAPFDTLRARERCGSGHRRPAAGWSYARRHARPRARLTSAWRRAAAPASSSRATR